MRKYHVKIVDENGNILLTFKGNVEKKTQEKGRYGFGDVVETLHVKGKPKISSRKKTCKI